MNTEWVSSSRAIVASSVSLNVHVPVSGSVGQGVKAEVTPASTKTEEEAKVRRVHLKDELYRMLNA
ncbi:MAG: YdcH family protein [Halieaceae bacterium]|nr:YdcH family protein [Halieaceae bacterium]